MIMIMSGNTKLQMILLLIPSWNENENENHKNNNKREKHDPLNTHEFSWCTKILEGHVARLVFSLGISIIRSGWSSLSLSIFFRSHSYFSMATGHLTSKQSSLTLHVSLSPSSILYSLGREKVIEKGWVCCCLADGRHEKNEFISWMAWTFTEISISPCITQNIHENKLILLLIFLYKLFVEDTRNNEEGKLTVLGRRWSSTETFISILSIRGIKERNFSY